MDQQTNCVAIATLPTVAMLVLLVIKDYRSLNFRQQMVVLQNQWQQNSGKIVDETHGRTRTISMRKICALCDKPNAHNYDLRVVILGSAKRKK